MVNGWQMWRDGEGKRQPAPSHRFWPTTEDSMQQIEVV
jgi:hypothetical protein